MCEPFRQLTKKDTTWLWTENHDQALTDVKHAITKAPILRYFDDDIDVVLQCDASQIGLGAVILQNQQPIGYASRTLTDTERRYAQIEKELLAIQFGLQHFDHYTYGRLVTVHTDHKPLEMIYKKALHATPKRLQRMLLGLRRYDLQLQYIRGSEMYIADTLSRAAMNLTEAHSESGEQILSFDDAVDYLPMREESIQKLRQATCSDQTLQSLKETVQQGWPTERSQVDACIRQYFSYRDELLVQNELVFKGERVLVPLDMRREMMQRIHYAHIGVNGCIRSAKECIFWPGMTSAIRDHVETCDVCRKFDNKQQKETLVCHDVPSRPWAKVGTDLFQVEERHYMVTVDYYSSFMEVDRLEDQTSKEVIKHLKLHFPRYGVPDVLVSDNGPQYTSVQFKQFEKDWGVEHVYSSPHYPQSNGKAESAVKIIKRIMRKSKESGNDPWLALLEYRNTPSEGMSTSPAQRMMGRRTKGLLPVTMKALQPEIVDESEAITRAKAKQKASYDTRAKDLPDLMPDDEVRIDPLHPDNPGRKQ